MISFQEFFGKVFGAIWEFLDYPLNMPQPVGQTSLFKIFLFLASMNILVNFITRILYGGNEE